MCIYIHIFVQKRSIFKTVLFFSQFISYSYIYFLQSYWKLAVHKTVNCKFNCFLSRGDYRRACFAVVFCFLRTDTHASNETAVRNQINRDIFGLKMLKIKFSSRCEVHNIAFHFSQLYLAVGTL